MEYYTSKDLSDYLANPANERDLRARAEAGWPKKITGICFEDAYQDSLLKLYMYVHRQENDPSVKKLKKENGEPFPFGYFFKVLRNTWLEMRRRQSSLKMLSAAEFVAAWAIFDPGLEKRWTAVQLAVSKLCTKCVELLYYRFELGFSIKDLSNAIGSSEKATKSRLEKCLEELRGII